MVLERQREPLRLAELPDPEPGLGQVLLSVAACGVCRTDLHIVDGELSKPKLPLVMGHQIVGTVAGAGEGAGVRRWESGSACPGWAGPAATAAMPRRPRESLRPRPLHRL